MTIQLRLSTETVDVLNRLTSPYGKRPLIEGLLRIADERQREMDAGAEVPFDDLTRLLVQEHERYERSAKRRSGDNISRETN